MTDVVTAGRWRAEPRSPWRIGIRRAPADVAELYEQLSAHVLGYLRAQGAPGPEYVLGEVFYQVARDMRQFSGSRTDQRRWVFMIARERMIDAFRRRSVRPAMPDGDLPELVAPGTCATPLDQELVAALAEVTAEQREVIALRFIANLSIRDVAVVTGRDVGAVKALEQRGVAALRHALDGQAGEPTATV